MFFNKAYYCIEQVITELLNSINLVNHVIKCRVEMESTEASFTGALLATRVEVTSFLRSF